LTPSPSYANVLNQPVEGEQEVALTTQQRDIGIACSLVLAGFFLALLVWRNSDHWIADVFWLGGIVLGAAYYFWYRNRRGNL
jgi:hypothetical protein